MGVSILLSLTLVHIHFPAVNLQDAPPRLFRRVGQLDLAIQSPGSQQSGIQNVRPVGRRDDLLPLPFDFHQVSVGVYTKLAFDLHS